MHIATQDNAKALLQEFLEGMESVNVKIRQTLGFDPELFRLQRNWGSKYVNTELLSRPFKKVCKCFIPYLFRFNKNSGLIQVNAGFIFSPQKV